MEKVIKVIEESFMKELIFDKTITDISYNGKNLYYYSTSGGRKFYREIPQSEVAVLLRNVANLTNERFSYIDTFLDVSFDKYRLSAMHYALSRFGYIESLSFALRINHNFLLENPHYLPTELEVILKDIMGQMKSIVISGATGVGKTTLQKYLLTLLPSNTRVLVIDNVLELGEVNLLNKSLDITLWQTRSNSPEEIKDYIQKALRFHPDYLLIAESRGSEMKEIVQGSISGHPNIVTLHAESVNLVHERIAYLINGEVGEAIYKAFPYIIHLSKKMNDKQEVVRYVSQIISYKNEKEGFLTLYCAD